MKDFDKFFSAYITAALWSSNDNSDPNTGGDPLDKNYNIDDFDEQSLGILKAHAMSFYSRMWYYIENEDGERDAMNAGHDFWLTQNGHGAGFWDGDWPKYGDMLTKLSRCYPEINIDVGDDGKLSI